MDYPDKILVFGPDKEILAQFSPNQIEEAYQYCLEIEEMGIKVEMHIPSLPEGLAHALGGTPTDCQKIRDELTEEISHHID